MSTSMTSSDRKVVAFCLLLLLAGHECTRISSMVDIAIREGATKTPSDQSDETEDTTNIEVPAEETLEVLNKASCRWSPLRLGCSGSGCKFRPLPLDRSLSDACRLSNTHMLSNISFKQRFVALEGDLLIKTSEKFRDECSKTTSVSFSKSFSRHQWRCYRRAGRILQATEFMTKAQQQVNVEPDANIAQTIKSHIETSMETFSTMLGENAHYLLRLKRGIEANAVEIVKEPADSTKKIVDSIFNLTSGSEREVEEAKETIDSMSMTRTRELSPDEQSTVLTALTRDGNKYDVNNESTYWSSLRRVVPLSRKLARAADAERRRSSEESLLQAKSELIRPRYVVTTRCTVNLIGLLVSILVMILLMWLIPEVLIVITSGTSLAGLGVQAKPIIMIIIFLMSLSGILDQACLR